MTERADAVIVGAGLSGLVAASELLRAGKRVVIVEQEPENSLGGQAWWSLGGLFLVDSPEQRRIGVKDGHELARQDWFASAEFDRDEDEYGRQWAETYLAFAAGEQRAWLRDRGVGLFPIVGWAERGGYTATAHGNSVPRFHITWGTGPAVLEPFIADVLKGVSEGRAELRFRHRVDNLLVTAGSVRGVSGSVLADHDAPRGSASNREVVDGFDIATAAVVIAAGGVGGNHDLVREFWPRWLGSAPSEMLSGVPAHVDGRMLGIAERAGARVINRDRMWHNVEGIENFAPVWERHGIRILPGPSSLWVDATGRRLPVPLFPGFDTLGTLEYLRQTGYDHSWFIATQAILEKEFALSGSEQNVDLTERSIRSLMRQRLARGAPDAVESFTREGEDFVIAETLDELFTGMKWRNAGAELDTRTLRREIDARDRELVNGFSKDAQVTAIRGARKYWGDRLIRVAKPRPIMDRRTHPLIAVKLRVLTRTTLGGIQTDLESRALRGDGTVIPGLYAVGEAAGFGGGGMHGYRSLEGTFLGGCMLTGRAAGRSIAAAG